MRRLVILAMLASCASWRSVDRQRLANYENNGRTKRVFIVTPREAFEIDLYKSDSETLEGDVIHAWTVSRDSPVFVDEEPDAMARRLQWTPQHTIPEQVHVPISSVLYARKRVYAPRTAPVLIVVGVAFLTLATAMTISLGQSLGE